MTDTTAGEGVPTRVLEAVAHNLCSLHDFDPEFVKGQERFARAVIAEYKRASGAEYRCPSCGAAADERFDCCQALAAQPSAGAQGEDDIWPQWAETIRKKLASYGVEPDDEGWNLAEDFEVWIDGVIEAETARAEKAEAELENLRATAAQPDTGGWIVGNAADDHWRTWVNGCPDWTSDRDLATRYYRREDAEQVHAEDEDAWRVTPYGKPDTGDVAALREARAYALEMTKKHGNPDGTDYEQGQNDMGFRWVSQLDTMIAALSKPNAPGREG